MTPQIKMKILSHMTSHKVCQPPPTQKMKHSVEKDNITNLVAIVMIKVFV